MIIFLLLNAIVDFPQRETQLEQKQKRQEYNRVRWEAGLNWFSPYRINALGSTENN